MDDVLTDAQSIGKFIAEKRRLHARRKALAVAAGIAVAVLVGVAGWLLLGRWGDPAALSGSFDEASPAGGAQDGVEHVAWNEMEISVASAMQVLEGQTRVEARLENPQANHLDQRVTIALADDPDDVLYESGAIRPGECIRYIELAHPLEPGTHTAVVTFQGYEREARLGGGGQLWGHDAFGASCAAEVQIVCVAA